MDSSSSNPSPIPQTQSMSFDIVSRRLPCELTLRILHYVVNPQRLVVHEFVQNAFKVEWESEVDAWLLSCAFVPDDLGAEIYRMRHLGWLRDTKFLDSSFDFYMSHYLIGPVEYPVDSHPWDELVAQGLSCQIGEFIRNGHSRIARHGFEKLWLGFDAEEYFAMFKVGVPPFLIGDENAWGIPYRDGFCFGAGIFLQATEELTLDFGSAYKHASPWTVVFNGTWFDDNFVPHVCESGQVVDWILSYAWHHEFLQHIPRISITGDVQDWVKQKWHDIFQRQAAHNRECKASSEPRDSFAIFKPDIDAIETIGRVPDDEETWRPELHYPPPCTCETLCSRLYGGRVEPECAETTWADVEQWPDVPIGDWYDSDEDVWGSEAMW